MDKIEGVAFPQDLAALSVQDLTALTTIALQRFDFVSAQEDIDETGVAELEELAAGIESAQSTIASKQATEKATAATMDRIKAMRAQTEAAAAKVDEKPAETPAEKPVEPVAAKVEETVVEPEVKAEVEPEAKPEEKVVAKTGGAKAAPVSLAAAQANAPALKDNGKSESLEITASAPTMGVTTGQKFGSVDDLVAAVSNHANSLVVSEGRPGFQTVARIHNTFDHVIDGERTSLGEIEALANELRSDDAFEALVAGGGWCAPSEIRYDFFNIACQDGAIDLPTFGVKRGGITHPVSPSFADVFTGTFTNATNPWLWTEADDILTVTGAPNKPCVRVLCPSFTDRRLECYGICLTAGNLTDYAYPEATRNHLSLLMSAHYHAMNQRYLQTMVALSTAATVFVTGAGWGNSIASDLPDAVAVAANDIRTRYGMCQDDVLEAVIPRWAMDAIRGDLTRRTGDAAYLNMTEADITAMFRTRRVRVQWVNDWQIRSAGYPGGASPSTAWPTILQFMIYPAGTFVRGNGLTLDLGVVRDSVLNAENDHTAAWTEECHLIARLGHESRLYQLPVCAGGKTGGTYSACLTA